MDVSLAVHVYWHGCRGNGGPDLLLEHPLPWHACAHLAARTCRSSFSCSSERASGLSGATRLELRLLCLGFSMSSVRSLTVVTEGIRHV